MTVMSAVADACSWCIVEFEVKTLRVMATARGTRSFICLAVPEHHPSLITKAPLVLNRNVVVVWQEEVVALGIVTAASRVFAAGWTSPFSGEPIKEHGVTLSAKALRRLAPVTGDERQRVVAAVTLEAQ